MDYFNYSRRQSNEVYVGATPMGGANPIRIQSMTNTVTMDTEACIEQAKRIIDAGVEYVRLTTQGVREAENLKNINAGLREQGYMAPLVADVHFNPKVADVAALYAEKVRINPGNYVDAARTFKKLEYTDEEYAQEIQKIRARFVPFLQICKENHTAIRIGVNHGSLSDRIMSRYGDTAYLCRITVLGCCNLHQGLKHGCYGQDCTIPCRTVGKGRYGLPSAFGSNGSRRRRGRPYQIGIRYRCPVV